MILDRNTPLESARAFSARFRHAGFGTLCHFDEVFHRWNRIHYERISDAMLRRGIYGFMSTARERCDQGLKKFNPTPNSVEAVTHALIAAVNAVEGTDAPAWLDHRDSPSPSEVILCRNGLLDVQTRRMISHTPKFFALHAVNYSYRPGARAPRRWQAFLNDLWPNDPESIATLQEIFGYLLTCDAKQQKIFLIIGPARSGKGTILRVLIALLGGSSVVSPTFYS